MQKKKHPEEGSGYQINDDHVFSHLHTFTPTMLAVHAG